MLKLLKLFGSRFSPSAIAIEILIGFETSNFVSSFVGKLWYSYVRFVLRFFGNFNKKADLSLTLRNLGCSLEYKRKSKFAAQDFAVWDCSDSDYSTGNLKCQRIHEFSYWKCKDRSGSNLKPSRPTILSFWYVL